MRPKPVIVETDSARAFVNLTDMFGGAQQISRDPLSPFLGTAFHSAAACGLTMELDYCVWAVSTLQPKKNTQKTPMRVRREISGCVGGLSVGGLPFSNDNIFRCIFSKKL